MSAASVAERITQALPEPFSIEGKEVFISASIGIAVAGTEDSASDLLRNADMAMYLAKSRGRARYEAFESRMHREAMERLELEGDLRRAVDRSEFFLLYQPIMTLRDGLVSGMEALLRWSHPRRGTIMPSAFIPLAEDTGLIVPLGQWVLREACRQARQWQLLSPTSTSALTLTVNISGHQLQHATIVDDVRGALAESGLDAGSLVLEITESVLMQHTETMLQRLQALKSVGVRLAIDDFGTGYSSLSYLQRFPIDILKIAKPFVDGVGAGANDSALARAIIALGDTLQLHTIAEGIELKEQLSGLQELGCEMGQGYYFAKPLSREAMQMMLESNRPGDTTVSPRARSRR
jgi:EAL domain-containing protein (putative c-di-GMP-specific phosphodiesterase class I)